MLLSSVNRLRLYTGLGDSVEETRALSIFLNSVSAVIQKELYRDFELKRRTEYFDYESGEQEFFPYAFPITNIASIHTDVTGLFTGSEVAELNYYVGQYSRSVVLWRKMVGNYKRGLRIIYDGGVAIDPVISEYTLTGTSSTVPEVDDYVRTAGYSGMGKVISYNDTTKNIKIESLYGAFKVGDALEFAQKENGDAQETKTGTISAIVSQSLVEQMPHIGQAIEMEIRYLQKNKDRFETQGTNKDGATTKRLMDGSVYTLQPETKFFLQSEARILL